MANMLRTLIITVLAAQLVYGVSISVFNNTLLCNGLECPSSADTCIVNTQSTNDRTKLVTVVKCLSNGSVVAENTTTEPNPGGGRVNSTSQSSIGGGSSYQSSNSFSSSSSNIDPHLGDKIAQQVNEQVATQLNNAFQSFPTFQSFPFSSYSSFPFRFRSFKSIF